MRAAWLVPVLAIAGAGCSHGHTAGDVLAFMDGVNDLVTLPDRIDRLKSGFDEEDHPRPQLVGQVTVSEPWGEAKVAFQKIALLSNGTRVGEGSTDREGAFSIVGVLEDGRYDLLLESNAYAAAMPVRLEGCRPQRVDVRAHRR